MTGTEHPQHVAQPSAARVDIAAVEPSDVDAISALAASIWWQHYPGIISAAQIEYMLEQRYRPALIRAELERSDLWWDKLIVSGVVAGFSSYVLIDGAGAMKLDKLYVAAQHRRHGYGGLLIERALQQARKQGCSRLTLAVNKRNDIALAAYSKHGFVVHDAVVKDIGGGFVMDDFILEKAV